MKILAPILATIIVGAAATQSAGESLFSPDGRLEAKISLPRVELVFDGRKALEVDIAGCGALSADGAVREVRGEWENAFGERRRVRDDYNALAFGGGDGPERLEVRCYNGAFAWRGVADDGTEAVFGGDWRCWPVSHNQGEYKPMRLGDFNEADPMPAWAPVAAGIGEMHNYENRLPGTMEGPFVVEGDGFVAALGEAANTHFAKLRFAKGEKANSVKIVLEGKYSLPQEDAKKPWRYVRLASNPCELYEGNDVVLNLNEPCRIADTSWIKPGKVLRVAKLDEETGRQAVDFVLANGMQYIELDCGWYGQEHTGNPFEPKEYVKPILAYAREKGVGVILYVNREPLKRAKGGIDEILPELKRWGVVGIKYGFVNVGAQRWNEWVSEAVRKGAENGLMLDIHDEYRLTGNQRTWPNVMTVEGIRGNEEMPCASHNAALVFTRYLAGPGDYTPCWKVGRVQNTLAHQLALGVATFSPWQFLFWYQRPAQIDAKNPALDIWKEMPTVWEDTKAIAGVIGEYAIVARKAADGRWFVAGLNANSKRTLEVPLGFLGKGAWKMRLVRDADADATNRLAAAAVSTNAVSPSMTISVEAASNGGFAAILEPADRTDAFASEGDDALADRLLMHWNTHATDVFVRDEAVVGVGGERAAVPTVMFDGCRGHVTQFKRPCVEELPRRTEDERGLFLEPLGGGERTWAPYGKTGTMICSLNTQILSIALDAAAKHPRMAFNTLDTYLRGILARNVPTDLNYGHLQTLFGMQSMETIHDNTLPKACALYSALMPWIDANAPECRAVFDAALKKWAEVQIANGVADNNWDIMQLNNILDVAIVLGDDATYADGKGRGHYLDVVMNKSSVRNLSVRDLCAKGFDASTGIWWECPGYSLVTLKDLAKFADKLQSVAGIDLYEEIPLLRKAFAAAGEYLFPDNMTIGFGDTHPSALPKEITAVAAPVTSPFFYAPNASWLAARSGMDAASDVAFALNASLGNHMHANGISLELYARGWRIAPDAGVGWSLYSGDDYKEYYSRYPAHNTVMVNSRSNYAPMKCHHAFSLDAHGDNWAEVSFRDPATGAEQKRTVAYVKDGEAAYFVDFFRSRIPQGAIAGGDGADADEWHDYYYHNFGDTLEFNAPTKPAEIINFAESGLYALSYIQEKQEADGQRDLDAKFTWRKPTGDVITRFFMNGAAGRTFVKALAPATEGLSRVKSPDYAITKESRTPVIVARQTGEAWDRPFFAVIDPSGQIASVEYTADATSATIRLKDGRVHNVSLRSGFSLSTAAVTDTAAEREAALVAKIPAILERAKVQYAELEKIMAAKPYLSDWSDGKKGKPGEWAFPRSWTRGKYKVEPAIGWTTGFYPGSLWLIYALGGGDDFKALAEKWTERLASAKDYTRNHDMGFMFFCSYGNGIKYGAHGDDYKAVIFDASKALATRWSENMHLIRSWDEPRFMQFPVIIDSMMNLEMLEYAAKNGAGEEYDRIARLHADKLDATHFRTNATAYHVTDWNPRTGKVWARFAWQGACVDGAWARGQGWSVYGFTMMFRETRDPKYLARAMKSADWIISAPNLPDDKIPFWDYFAADIPNAPRDASAAAVMASGLIELSTLAPQPKAAQYRAFAVDMLTSLASDAYLAAPGECGGFLLKHSTGHLPENTEIDASINYADYYFLEALLRLTSRH